MKQKFFIVMMIFFCTCLSLGSHAKTKETTNEMNGNFWKTLSTRSSQGSLLLYTSGYLNGYDHALSQVLEAMKKQPYSQKDLIAFIDVLRFPNKVTNMAIKQEIDTFYQDEKNQTLPVFVAFTVARQILQGYPKSYTASYITKIRKHYKKESVQD